MIVVVMGVSGAGKTVVGRLLAQRLGVSFIEGDEHHSRANVDKMSAGKPLSDQDRTPWLDELATDACRLDAAGQSCVLTCSALKRVYRVRLSSGCPAADWRFVHLTAPRSCLAARVAGRKDHFMPSSLLESQLEALEPLGPDEPGVEIDARESVAEVAREALNWLQAPTDPEELARSEAPAATEHGPVQPRRPRH